MDEYKIKGMHREAKRESKRLARLNPGSFATSGMHLRMEVIVKEGRKAAEKRAERAGAAR